MKRSPNASTTMIKPITIATFTNPLISHIAGFLDHLTLYVDKDIFTKSVIKIIINIADADITYFPNIRKAKTTKQVFKMVLAILLSIQVFMRWNIILPILMGPIISVRPSSVNTMLAAPLATSLALLT